MHCKFTAWITQTKFSFIESYLFGTCLNKIWTRRLKGIDNQRYTSVNEIEK